MTTPANDFEMSGLTVVGMSFRSGPGREAAKTQQFPSVSTGADNPRNEISAVHSRKFQIDDLARLAPKASSPGDVRRAEGHAAVSGAFEGSRWLNLPTD